MSGSLILLDQYVYAMVSAQSSGGSAVHKDVTESVIEDAEIVEEVSHSSTHSIPSRPA